MSVFVSSLNRFVNVREGKSVQWDGVKPFFEKIIGVTIPEKSNFRGRCVTKLCSSLVECA